MVDFMLGLDFIIQRAGKHNSIHSRDFDITEIYKDDLLIKSNCKSHKWTLQYFLQWAKNTNVYIKEFLICVDLILYPDCQNRDDDHIKLMKTTTQRP